jgi:hypothetical protein
LTDRFVVKHVLSIPDQLSPGVIYVSREFETAHHLCACGCGARVRTPLKPTEWRLTETKQGPSLWPSVGNWQKGCQSHYVIRNGRVLWFGQWTQEDIQASRSREAATREAYYAPRRVSWFAKWFGRRDSD